MSERGGAEIAKGRPESYPGALTPPEDFEQEELFSAEEFIQLLRGAAYGPVPDDPEAA